jgi:hypothetical protein
VQPKRAAGGVDLDLGDVLDAPAGKRVEAVDAQLGQPLGDQVGQQHKQLGQRVADGRAGEERAAATARVAAA